MKSLRAPAEVVDALPFMPAQVADRALRRLVVRRRRLAASDMRWSQIEGLRGTGRTKVLFGDGLELKHWMEQRRIAEDLTPDPRWVPVARRMTAWTLSNVTATAQQALQRARRGWSVADTYNADQYITGVVAGMLEHMAANAAGWPASEEFPTHESWTSALRATALDLRLAHHDPALEAAKHDYLEVVADPHASDVDIAAAQERRSMRELERDTTVESAMRWVADHLLVLWD